MLGPMEGQAVGVSWAKRLQASRGNKGRRTVTPQYFINKWRNVELTERSASQSHFIDLCHLLDEPAPTDADPAGEWYAFEKGAVKTGGGDGWADVWKRGHFAWEYKRTGGDLQKAYVQLQRYAVALEQPPLLIVADTQRIRIHTNWTNTVQQTTELQLEELADGQRRRLLKWAFADPDQLKPGKTRQQLTEEAAEKFVWLAQRLRERGHAPSAVAHFVNRMVFCMFAEDVNLLPRQMFRRMLEESRGDPAVFVDNARALFGAMRAGGRVGFERVEWFNGGIFDDDMVLPLEPEDIKETLAAAQLDWSNIDPSIMGTLFERGLDPDKRSQLGAHYTDADKIDLIIQPAVVAPLVAEWSTIKEKIAPLMDRARKHRDKAQKTRAFNDAQKLHLAFVDKLKAYRILDPACGSGNFLYMALRALKDVEHRANLDAEALGLPRGFPTVGPECVRGIEINPFAAELARVSIWIGEIQWMQRNGFDVSRSPILKSLDNIECRDALLNPDGTEADWPEADAIIGNPPFVAARDMVPELGGAYTDRVRKIFEPLVEGGVDFVCYWFIKAAKELEAEHTSHVGLVCTNSVPRSVSRKAVDYIARHGHIASAVSNMLWSTAPLRGGTGQFAAVRISIICVDRAPPRRFVLDGREVRGITTDLYETSPDLLFSQEAIRKLDENAEVAFQGIVPRSEVKKSEKLKHRLPDASFAVSGATGRALLIAKGNPNARPNSDVVKRYIVAEDLTDRDEERFIVDFSGMTEQQAAQYQEPFAAIQAVRAHRAKMAQADALATWWKFWRARTDSRAMLSTLPRYIATPRSAKHRTFVFVDARIVPDNAVVWFATDSLVTFGILHSRIHEVWTLRRCSYQGVADTPRYKHTDVFEPFPFPEGLQPRRPSTVLAAHPCSDAIAQAATSLAQLRDNWLNPTELVKIEPEVIAGYPDRIVPANAAAADTLRKRTLTALYNDRPPWLADAHAALDVAVATAYGWPTGLSDEQILERLFALNQERAAAQEGGSSERRSG